LPISMHAERRKRTGQGFGIAESIPFHHAGEDDGHGDVKNSAYSEAGENADGHVTFRVASLFCSSRDGVKAYVRKEDNSCGAGNAFDAVGGERHPVLRVHVKGAEDEKEADEEEFQDYKRSVEASGFPDAY